MKKLIFTAALAVAAFTSNAQNTFDNDSDCDLRIRVVCIDETGSCSVVSTGMWVSLPAHTTGNAIPAPTTCIGVNVAGYEIGYAPSTGCTATTIFTTNPSNPCPVGPFTGIAFSSAPLAACACNVSGNGSPLNIHHDFQAGVLNEFRAH